MLCSTGIERVCIVGSQHLERLQGITKREQVLDVLIDLVHRIREQVDDRFALARHGRTGAVDKSMGDAVKP